MAGAILRYAIRRWDGWEGGKSEFAVDGPLLEQPLRDCLDAVRLLRARKEELGLSGRIVVLGFSAGGHLAATLSTHGCHDPATRVDGSILVYPVISMMEGLTHGGSRENLLGPGAPRHLCELFSNEMRVTAETPPAFVVHGWNDAAVKVENAMAYCGALREKGVKFELHVYPEGDHGFGMGEGKWGREPIGEWPRLAGVWATRLLEAQRNK
jgi:acetyl esterase/lipase